MISIQSATDVLWHEFKTRNSLFVDYVPLDKGAIYLIMRVGEKIASMRHIALLESLQDSGASLSEALEQLREECK